MNTQENCKTSANEISGSGPDPNAREGLLENRWIAAGILLTIILAGTGLRLYQLSDRSMWFDESVSWRFIQFPFTEMIARIARDVIPPFYFILLRFWAAVFGQSLLALRGLSVLSAAVAMGGIYLAASEAFAVRGAPSESERNDRARARWIGLVGAALFAVSVLQIRLGVDTRMYAIATALLALSSWVLLLAIRARSRACLLWIIYGLLTLLLAHTLYFGLFSIAGQGIFLLGYIGSQSRWVPRAMVRSRLFWSSVMAYAITGIGSAFWLPVFLRQKALVQESWWSAPFALRDVPGLCYSMFFDVGASGITARDSRIVAVVCAAAVLALLWKARVGEWFVFCLGAVTFAISIAVSLQGGSMILDRYLVLIQMFVLMTFAVVISRLPGTRLRNAAAGVLIAGGLMIYVDFMAWLDLPNKPGTQGACEYLVAQRQSSEPVIVCSTMFYFPMCYHAHSPRNWYVYYEEGKIPFYAGSPLLTSEDTITREQVDAITSKRVWVVTSNGYWARGDMPIPSHWRPENERQFMEAYPFQGDVLVVAYLTVEGEGANGTQVLGGK